MSDADRLAQYADYYRARAARYAANPLYPETAAAEQRMADAVAAATSFAEMQRKLGELSVANARARARDQADARFALFADTQDTVRAQAPAEILEHLDRAGDPAAVAALAANAEERTHNAVIADELTRQWANDLVSLEDAEMWRTAEVPERWRAQLEAEAEKALAAARESWASLVATAARYEPGWQFDDDTAREPRHRRLVPLPGDVFERRLAEHRTLIRGGI